MRAGDTGIEKGIDKEFVAVAFIVKTHGLKGEVKVIQLSDKPERIYSLGKITIINKKGGKKESSIRSARAVKGGYVLSLSDIKSAGDAEEIVGSYLAVPADEVPELGKDEWYHFEIIGIDVYTTDEQYLGQIDDILSTGSNDVYIVRDGEHEYLIPGIREVVKEVDIKGRRMVIALMEGLIEM